MRNKMSLWKRSLAALLSFAMVLGMVPALGGGKIALEAEAVPAEGVDYITLPITIRDFAADGMLFEYNEVDSSDTITIGGSGAVGYPVHENPTSWDVDNYYSFRLYDYGEIAFDTTNSGLNWHCVICDASGNVVDVLAVGEEKQTTYDSVMQDGYFSIWVWQGDQQNYSVLSKVTDTNASNYAIDFHYDSDAEAYKMYIGYRYNENAWGDNYTGINYFAAGQTPFADGYDALWADCLICDSNGNVIQTIAAGTEKQTTFNAMTSGFALFATPLDSVARSIIQAIANSDDPTVYQATFVTDNYYGTDLLFLGSASESMTIHQADTKGFGLLLTGSNDRIQNLTTTSGPGTYVSNGAYGSEDAPADVNITLNSGAKQILHGATIRYDLVGPKLVNGKPAYTKETVTYLANYMSEIMNEVWQNDDGSYNSFFVMGTKMFDETETYVGPDDPTAVYDLAEILRRHVTGGLGSYEETMEKLKANADALSFAVLCETWFDAAYYLLHYTWQDNPKESGSGNDGYGKYVPEYDSLQLIAKNNTDGTTTYVFNSGYDNTVYDPSGDRDIYNSQISTITAAQNSSGDFYTRGLVLPAARFNPLGPDDTGKWLGYGQNAGGNTYGDLVGSSATQLWDEYYDDTNYHLSLEGHAEFIFRYASNLYFTFTGDDDVYLYINGVRVLDLGGAHSIVEATINLNDVMELCGLKEGEPARFDFFYLERHGTAANFGIETNIQLAASGMTTTKQGYQSGVTTGYNGPVNPEKPVAYSFTLKNTGGATLEHLTFVDLNLGVSLSEYELDWGNKIEGTNANGTLVGNGPLDKMYVYIRDENDAIVSSYSAATDPVLDDAQLRSLLEKGLPTGHSMTIYNLRYTISAADWGEANVFDNVVTTTGIANGKQLNGTAEWRVRKANLVTEPLHIYNWVNKTLNAEDWTARDVSLTKTELIQPARDAASDITDTKAAGASIVLCNGSGYTDETLWSDAYKDIISNVTLDANGNLTYNSKAPGMVTVFYKIMGIGYDETIYHFDVITYGVADNVYVLDYGLDVELNGDDFGLRVNDHLSVPQNIHATNVTVIGIQDATQNYGTFTLEGSSLKYIQNDIVDNTDSVRVNIRVLEEGATEVTKFTGVDMHELVTTAPASVVYYEENHPGITYVTSAPKLHANSAGYLLDISYNLICTTSEQIVTADDDGYLYDGDGNYIQDKDMQYVMIDEDYNLVDEAGDLIADTSLKLKVDDDDNLILVTLLKRVKINEVNGDLYLVDEAGNSILDVNDQPVQLDDEAHLVDADGNKVEVTNLSGLPVMVSNQWVQYETVDDDGNSVAGTNQSADQDMNYGYDPNYAADKEGQWNDTFTVIGSTTFELDVNDVDELQAAGIAALNDYLGLTGTDSNGTVKELVVNETDEVMYFDFVGTGFEIVSRTTDEQYAVIDVRVYLWDDEKNQPKINMEGTEGYDENLPDTNSLGIVRRKPVITESKGGDLYQVPIISITGMKKANYRVSVWAGTTGNVQRVLYIDGIRIYGPLEGDSAALNYYNPEEYEAKFFEVKTLIQNGQAIYADASNTDDDLILVTGTTMVEDTEEGGVLVALEGEENVSRYMTVGPNNELYLDSSNYSMIAFFITPDADYHGGERTLEIGAHRKADSTIYDNSNVYMAYGSTAQSIIDGTNMYTISSGTEMYYTIDVEKLVKDEKTGKYLVMIGANSSDLLTTLALTSIKAAGYTITFAEAALMSANAEGDVLSTPIAAQTFALLRTFRAPAEEEPEVVQIPVNEKLKINSAKLRATQIVSGRTATVTVKAGKAAQRIVITDADGNVVETDKVVRQVSGTVATFTVIWKVYGSRGDKLEYTIRVYDADVLASVNMETVTVTIK